MIEFLFWLNVALALGMFIGGFCQPTGYMQLPFLIALPYAGWYLPQAAVLLDDTSLPTGGLSTLLVMSFLCLAATWAGWRLAVGPRPLRRMKLIVPVDQLKWPTLILTLVAITIQILIMSRPDEERAAGIWTGPLTILAFFSRIGIVSGILSCALLLERRSLWTIALAGANLVLFSGPLLIAFRRSDTVQFIFLIMLCLFFVIGKRIPRVFIAVGMIAGFAYVNGVAHLRSLSGAYALSDDGKIESHVPTLEEISQIDWFDVKVFEEGKLISETRNAAVSMYTIDKTGSLSLGAEVWDQLIFSYVPGQLVGFDFKRSFMSGADLVSLATNAGGYESLIGTTWTGFTQPYHDFWFLGAFVFFFLGRYMGQHFLRAHLGSLKSLCIYTALLPMALETVTHSGYYVLINSPLLLFSIWFTFRFAKTGWDACRRPLTGTSKTIKHTSFSDQSPPSLKAISRV
jgi:hypothetical protein